jgi:hypothetical protein
MEYIYVLKCQDAVKVGYTTNLEQRIKSHQTSNPFAEFVCSYNGSIEDEKYIHKKLSKHLKEGCKEWFNYYDGIFEDIGCYINNISKTKKTLSINPFMNGNKINVVSKFGNLVETQNKISLYYDNHIDIDDILFNKLTSKARDLFLYISYHLPQNQDYINLKINDVRAKTGISRNAIVTALQSLKSANLIIPKNQSIYWVNPMYIFKGNRVSFYGVYGDNHLNIINDNKK